MSDGSESQGKRDDTFDDWMAHLKQAVAHDVAEEKAAQGAEAANAAKLRVLAQQTSIIVGVLTDALRIFEDGVNKRGARRQDLAFLSATAGVVFATDLLRRIVATDALWQGQEHLTKRQRTARVCAWATTNLKRHLGA